MGSAVAFIDSLARKNSEALSFIPTPKLEEYERAGQVLLATENDEPCGFIVFGGGWPVLRVYQACVQYDARRLQHGLDLVARLLREATVRGCDLVSLWCADDLAANEFWRAAGFVNAGQREGGARRGRVHNKWEMRVGAQLWLPIKEFTA